MHMAQFIAAMSIAMLLLGGVVFCFSFLIEEDDQEFVNVYGIRGIVCHWIIQLTPAWAQFYRYKARGCCYTRERWWYRKLWDIAMSKSTEYMDNYYSRLEAEYFGDPVMGTGIYHPDNQRSRNA